MADSDDKTQDGAHKKTLTLKGGPAVGARAGMSRGGRSTVVVERKNRVVAPHGPAGAAARPAGSAPAAPPPRQSAPAAPRADARPAGRPAPGPVPRSPGLSNAESEARARVLREAGARAAEDNRRAQEAEARRVEDEAR